MHSWKIISRKSLDKVVFDNLKPGLSCKLVSDWFNTFKGCILMANNAILNRQLHMVQLPSEDKL